jgi:Xaa-Pro dipeptidase
VFFKAGYDDITTGSGVVRNIIHHTGGRIDGGNFRKYNNRPLEPGMVLTIEPWARIKGIGGAHHCNVVLVTVTGMEVLTSLDAGVIRVGANSASIVAVRIKPCAFGPSGLASPLPQPDSPNGM